MILYKVADKIIFNILKRINVGYLEITTISGEPLRFGNALNGSAVAEYQLSG